MLTSTLAPGLLVAAPPLGDPNFDRSVILLAQHDADGAFGWVINGPGVMTLAELVVRAELTDKEPDTDGVVRLGGPVSQEQVWLMYRTEQRPAEVEGQFEVCTGVTASASRDVLATVARTEQPSSLFAVVGYAGWGAQQLEREINGGAWLPTDVDADIVFGVPTDKVWQHAFERVGTTPMAFTSRTVGRA